ncbi:hypothetical protein EDC01DRAFT_627118 [Geopyxis carbonaria]|nr:hypothetical protein EDC01DRAFT_627118 [Geopyxis carbonaria]
MTSIHHRPAVAAGISTQVPNPSSEAGKLAAPAWSLDQMRSFIFVWAGQCEPTTHGPYNQPCQPSTTTPALLHSRTLSSLSPGLARLPHKGTPHSRRRLNASRPRTATPEQPSDTRAQQTNVRLHAPAAPSHPAVPPASAPTRRAARTARTARPCRSTRPDLLLAVLRLRPHPAPARVRLLAVRARAVCALLRGRVLALGVLCVRADEASGGLGVWGVCACPVWRSSPRRGPKSSMLHPPRASLVPVAKRDMRTHCYVIQSTTEPSHCEPRPVSCSQPSAPFNTAFYFPVILFSAPRDHCSTFYRAALAAQHQRVKIVIDHGNGGLQFRSISGALVGWVDPLDDARAMRVLAFLNSLGKGERVGGIIKHVTVGWPGSGPRLHPAEGKMVMRLLKTKSQVCYNMGFHSSPAGGKAVKTQKGVAGGRVVKKTKIKPKPKVAIAVAGVKAGAVKMGTKDEGKTILAVPQGACANEEE